MLKWIELARAENSDELKRKLEVVYRSDYWDCD